MAPIDPLPTPPPPDAPHPEGTAEGADDASPTTDLDGSVTALLARMAAGDDAARAGLIEQVYDELRALAGSQLARQRSEHTLQPTALVHEAYLKLVEVQASGFDGRRHFYALAAQVMRAVLVDHARARGALKRGGGASPSELDEQTPAPTPPLGPVDLLDLGLALDDLAGLDPDLARAAELRHLAGLSVAEIAATMALPVRTAERRLRSANAWLKDRLHGS